ncbi:hypothetical protein AnigIFM50267_003134 [Aspergillus niger]|nr:hypothetical protein AnigIFM50267_003134 [Aspergillus niger]
MHEGLRSEDVTDIAEDDDKVREKYKITTGIDGIVEEVVAKPVCIRGPFDHTTAVIVWLRSEIGTVKIFLGDKNVQTWQTSPGVSHRVTMVFLEPGYYCWWMKGAKVKYVQRNPSP